MSKPPKGTSIDTLSKGETGTIAYTIVYRRLHVEPRGNFSNKSTSAYLTQIVLQIPRN